MRVIGITGPTGAGKTTALNVLRDMGCRVIDADGVYHGLLAGSADLKAALTGTFGDGILDGEGQIDRRRLADAVYPDRLEELNRITWPFVVETVEERIGEAREAGQPAAIDAIALIESGLAEKCDTVVAVLAPLSVRVERIMARDHVDEGYARRRIRAQKPNAFFLAHSDHVLENGEKDTPETFGAKAKGLFEKIIGEG